MEFDTVDISDWNREDKLAFVEENWTMNERADLIESAEAGILREDGFEWVATFVGDEPAEALGDAYAVRDTLQENGHEVEADLTGKAWDAGNAVFYEVRFTIDGGGEEVAGHGIDLGLDDE